MTSPVSHRRTPWTLAATLPPVRLSIELFPPRCAASSRELWSEIERLEAIDPAFYSVTCGAGGNGNTRTFEVVETIRSHSRTPVAAHVTCIGRSRTEADALADAYWEAGIRRLVALRGDVPEGTGSYVPDPGGYAFAADLVAALKRRHPFEISVACYPEVHPEAADAEADLDNLKRKVDAGACEVLGQYCFDTERVLRFRDALAARGIGVPFAPGIMPIHNFRQIRRFSERCGAGVPAWLAGLFDGVEEGSTMHQMIAATVAAEQCRRLVAEGFEHLHLYALNRGDLTLAIWRLLGCPKELRLAA